MLQGPQSVTLKAVYGFWPCAFLGSHGLETVQDAVWVGQVRRGGGEALLRQLLPPRHPPRDAPSKGLPWIVKLFQGGSSCACFCCLRQTCRSRQHTSTATPASALTKRCSKQGTAVDCKACWPGATYALKTCSSEDLLGGREGDIPQYLHQGTGILTLLWQAEDPSLTSPCLRGWKLRPFSALFGCRIECGQRHTGKPSSPTSLG